MPTFNVYFFVVKPPQPPHIGRSGGTATLGGGEEPSPAYTGFITRLQELLTEYFQRSLLSVPGNDEQNTLGWQAQTHEVPPARPGVPDFTGLTIQPCEPIIYLVSRNHAPTPEPRRRATYVMIEAFEQARFGGTPDGVLSDWRDALRSPSEVRGISMIPWIDQGSTESFRYAPLVPEVFTDLSMLSTPAIFGTPTISELARSWTEIMSNFVARAAFHEVAHCKAENYNQPPGSSGHNWANTRSQSIHGEPGAGILATAVAWTTAPTAADFALMGRHMLCPAPFYRLDQPLDQQLTNQGQPYTPTVQAESAASETSDELVDPDDPLGDAF